MVGGVTKQFNDIFRYVATTRKFRRDEPCCEKAIGDSMLTHKQCLAVTKLRDLLVSTENVARALRVRDATYEELSNVAVPWDPVPATNGSEKEEVPQTATEKEALTRVTLLREYLIRELIRGDKQAEMSARQDDALVYLYADRLEIMQKLAKYEPVPGIRSYDDVHQQRRPVAPLDLVGSFIRKRFTTGMFFGLVVLWDAEHSYYLVVYEDADNEDLEEHQVTELLWKFYIPNRKLKACAKHAAAMGHYIQLADLADMDCDRRPAKKQAVAGSSSDSADKADTFTSSDI